MKLIMCFGVIVMLAACAGSDRGLRDLRSNGGGPDEFRVMPVGTLILPNDITNLPTPTPGQSNRTDPTPSADAVAVLGGNPNALIPNGIPASDGALVTAASRNGVDPTIRQTLASEDAAFRTSQSRFGFIRGRDRYFGAYARQALDAYPELQRFRNAGVATPSAPPQ
jgi:hypothetical protein